MYQNIYLEDTDNSRGIVHLWDDTEGYSSFPYSKFNYAYKPSSHGTHLSLTGERCEKTYRYKRDDDSLFESDVPRETRVLSDLYLEDDSPSIGHTILYFDIEVSMKNGIPTSNNPNNEIISICAYDSKTQIYKIFVLTDNTKSVPTSLEYDLHVYNSETKLLEGFLHYWESIQPTIVTGWNTDNFDIPYLYHRMQQLVGMDVANRLSPIGLITFSTFRSKYMIAGVSSLDYFNLYKKFTYTQQPSYRLHAIGMFELGMGKVEYTGSLDNLYENDLLTFINYNIQDVKIVVELDKKLKLIELIRGICHVGHVPYEDYSYSSKFLEGTILTYLHRKGIVSTNKPAGGKEQMRQRLQENEEGFEGAYVKPPLPGLYKYVYSLDLQSLYPSIIMSLNISPETKRGKILDWNIQTHLNGAQESYTVQLMDSNGTIKTDTMNKVMFNYFLQETQYAISSNGILYDTDVKGIIPEILEKWFAERKEYKALMEEWRAKGDVEQTEFYNRRQHIQKIFLNSLYGVLGLPIFRFYDLENAAAVTLSGQDVIKTSAKFLSNYYKNNGAPEKTPSTLQKYKQILLSEVKKNRLKFERVQELLDSHDHCIYVDTDSLYFSSLPLATSIKSDDLETFTIQLARKAETLLNDMYNILCVRLFNVNPKNHKLYIKGEKIARTALWLAKKRYALFTTFDLESNTSKEKMVVKGLDIIRSTFPPLFREFMYNLTQRILENATKEEIDSKILELYRSLSTRSYIDIARNTAVQGLIKYTPDDEDSFTSFAKGTPIHVKSAISYNRLLSYFKLNSKFPPISDGEKIKYVYLKPNKFKLDSVAFKGDEDPPEIIQFITEHIDYNKLFEAELKDKLGDYYIAMDWGLLPTEQNSRSADFFSF